MRSLYYTTDLLNDIFNSFDRSLSSKEQYKVLKSNIVDNEDHYSILLEVPGFLQDEVNIEVKDRVLNVKAEKEKKQDEVKYLVKEIDYSKAGASFSLTKDVDVDTVKAKMENGLLEISIGKKEEEKPKMIKIN
ncbi:MAG: Hsp20/alpha crystallin family protein [Spirochaetes bacterium]|nr:Hsp20/alpha crystallin family protein [Spirochaetota bacterium]